MKKIINKKIIFFTNNASFINSHRKELLDYLIKKKNIITIATNLDEKIDICPINLININKFYLLNIFKYLAILNNGNYDLIHSIGIKTNLLLTITSIFHNNKIILHFTGLGNLFSQKKYLLLKYIVIIFFNLFKRSNISYIFQKNEDLNQIDIFRSFNKKNTYIIPGSGVDNKKFKIKNKFDHKNIRVLMASRLVKGKGIETYLDIAKKMMKDKKFIFYFAGKKNVSGISINLNKFYDEIDKIKNFTYLGEEKNMHILLRDIDLVVYPSNYGEGIPRFLLESLASGIPIICSNNPSSKYVVDDKINGTIIKNDSVDEYVDNIKFYSKISVRKTISKYSKKKSLNLFDISKIIKLHEIIYENFYK